MAINFKSRFSISSFGIKKRNQLAFFLSSIIPLIILAYFTMNYFFPETGGNVPRGVFINSSSIVIVALIMLALAGYRIAMQDTDSLLKRSKELSEQVGKINELALLSLLNPPSGDAGLLLSQVIKTAVTLTKSSTGVIMSLDEDGMFSYRAIGGTQIKNLEGVMVPSNIGITGFCFNNRKPYYTNDIENDSIFDLRSDRLGDFEIRNLLAVPLLSRGEAFGVMQLVNKENQCDYNDLDLTLTMNLALNISSTFENPIKEPEKHNHLEETAGIISTLLEANGLGVNHHVNVAKYADLMGELLLDNALEKEDLHLASLLHNIGLVFIEHDFRSNQEIYQRHPKIGFDLLKKLPPWRNTAICVLHHHENFDGTGYPDGLQGEDIPLPSRILAVAEYYDNLTNPSLSKNSFTPEEAKYEIINSSGTYFDPRVVDAFVETFEHFEKVD